MKALPSLDLSALGKWFGYIFVVSLPSALILTVGMGEIVEPLTWAGFASMAGTASLFALSLFAVTSCWRRLKDPLDPVTRAFRVIIVLRVVVAVIAIPLAVSGNNAMMVCPDLYLGVAGLLGWGFLIKSVGLPIPQDMGPVTVFGATLLVGLLNLLLMGIYGFFAVIYYQAKDRRRGRLLAAPMGELH